MTPTYELILQDGRAAFRDVSAKANVKLGGQQQCAYDNAQQAGELAVRAIAALTGRMKGDLADEKAVAQALAVGEARLTIRGHIRECRVVALHLHARYGLDYDHITSGTTVGGVRIDAVADAPDGYATYCFDSDMRPIEAMRGFVDRWLKEVSRYPAASENAQRNAPRWREVLRIGAKEGAPVRVVVTGVTGAGKSTFLNAVLGREILPHSSGVCTAAVLRLRKSARHEEGFEVLWRDVTELEKRAEGLDRTHKAISAKGHKAVAALWSNVGEVSSNLGVLEERARLLPTEIAALREATRAAREAGGHRQRLPLKELGKYARNAPDSFASAVNAIDVFLDHPLLEHVELIDAPGLRDGDEQRQKLLALAFAGDAAWLYLAPADTRSDSCRDDWKRIQESSHNQAGVLLLTKADGQPSDRGRTIGETMAARFRDYQGHGWRRAVEWCAALFPAELAALGELADANTLSTSWHNAKLPVLLGMQGKAEARRLEDFMHDRRATRDDWSTFVDYALDASRLPAALRRVGAVLYEDAIARRVKEGRDTLLQSVKEAIEHIVISIGKADQILKAHDVVEEQRRQLTVAREDLDALGDQLDIIRKKHADMLADLDEDAGEQRESLKETADEFLEELEDDFLKSFKRQSAKIYMSGPRDFPLVAKFESPLSEAAHAMLAKHASAAVKALPKAIGSAAGVNGVDLRELLSNYVLLDVASVGDVHDEEDFWEWEETTRDRMWKEVSQRARNCVKGMRRKFDEKMKAIRKRVANHLEVIEEHHRQVVKERKGEIGDLERAITANKPGESRERAETALGQLREHQGAFEGFLAELQRPSFEPRTNVFTRATPAADDAK